MDGSDVGIRVGVEVTGESVGDIVGDVVTGESVGESLGEALGSVVTGESEGSDVGEGVGPNVSGDFVGTKEGQFVGSVVSGETDGSDVGSFERIEVVDTGAFEGSLVSDGESVGLDDGRSVGLEVSGERVGREVVVGVEDGKLVVVVVVVDGKTPQYPLKKVEKSIVEPILFKLRINVPILWIQLESKIQKIYELCKGTSNGELNASESFVNIPIESRLAESISHVVIGRAATSQRFH